MSAELKATVAEMVVKGKGILAADESVPTISKRFAAVGVDASEENRRAYREMLFGTKGAGEFISGVIMFEETLYQKTAKGKPFPELLAEQGIITGIKVDKGLIAMDEQNIEKATQGLDDLADRLKKYKKAGARFAKWRAVYSISQKTPSEHAININAKGLAKYAALCQANGIVPIVEPEVLLDGDHPLETSATITTKVLAAVFEALKKNNVQLEYIYLKPSMVVAGNSSKKKATILQAAKATVEVLKATVPSQVPWVVFLSGGQSSPEATAHLQYMVANHMKLPWILSFSYGRALQDDAMKAWSGDPKNTARAQAAFFKRARLNSLAALGKYAESMEQK